jgi:hypothetical protein
LLSYKEAFSLPFSSMDMKYDSLATKEEKERERRPLERRVTKRKV